MPATASKCRRILHLRPRPAGWEIIPPLIDRASPLRSAHLRDPYGPPILFASECFIDEVAAATNADPVEFRLHYLKDPRDSP